MRQLMKQMMKQIITRKKILNLHKKTINLNSMLQVGMMNLIYLMDHTSDGQISDVQQYFEYIIKKHETIANNPPFQIYVICF